jgi:hypothetical protein
MSTETAELAYEKQIYQQRRWGMDEGDRHFKRESEVFKTLRRIAKRLESLGVPYAVAGGMALDAHGFRRLTVDVDILVTGEGLRLIHEKLDGLGYLPPFEKSKNLRDTQNKVRVEFLVAGEYPGDGRPKPIAFPDPAKVAVELDGIYYLNLPTLVELKTASGMTDPGRLKDLGDVQELISALDLPADFADKLNPFVRDKYLELWKGVKDSAANRADLDK